MARRSGSARLVVVAPGVEARPAHVHPRYFLRAPEGPRDGPRTADEWRRGGGPAIEGWDTATTCTAISTTVLAVRFLAGESVGCIASDYGLSFRACEAALRWEMLSRRVRVARVRRAVLGLR